MGRVRLSTEGAKYGQSDDEVPDYEHLAGKAGITKKAAANFSMIWLRWLTRSQEYLYPAGRRQAGLVNRKARMGRNPQTGDALKIPASGCQVSGGEGL